MRRSGFVCVVMIFTGMAFSQGQGVMTQPNQFEIARHMFFDFGPPFDFYELFIVRSTASGSSVEKILLTPPGNACLQPATIETSSASLNDSVSTLLELEDPCT